jgi:GTPase SAR1 family protein
MVRLAEGRFDGQTEPTMCPAYAQHSPPDTDGAILQFWNTARIERYRSINGIYYQDAAAALLTFGVSERRTFGDVGRWKAEFEKAAAAGAAVILVGTKCDRLLDCQVAEEEARGTGNRVRPGIREDRRGTQRADRGRCKGAAQGRNQADAPEPRRDHTEREMLLIDTGHLAFASSELEI